MERMQESAMKLRDASDRGEPLYSDVDECHVFSISCSSIRGRTGVFGQTFGGKIDIEQGKIRVDCAEDPRFWLEIDLTRLPIVIHPEKLKRLDK